MPKSRKRLPLVTSLWNILTLPPMNPAYGLLPLSGMA